MLPDTCVGHVFGTLQARETTAEGLSSVRSKTGNQWAPGVIGMKRITHLSSVATTPRTRWFKDRFFAQSVLSSGLLLFRLHAYRNAIRVNPHCMCKSCACIVTKDTKHDQVHMTLLS
jgi:hypothetical protein